MQFFISCFGAIFWTVCFGAVPAISQSLIDKSAAQALPPEDRLPTDWDGGVDEISQVRTVLPDEAWLPSTRPNLRPLDDRSDVAKSNQSTLPSESSLPDQPVVSPGTPDQPSHNQTADGGNAFVLEGPNKEPSDGFDDDVLGEDRPILRLNYSGHTGRIRSMSLSTSGDRIVTGGEDKDLHVWQRDPRNEQHWIHQRTIRWQVWRGPRGWIYDTAVHGDQIALAGYGAMGGAGEIWIAKLSTGKWERTLVNYTTAHRQAVDCVVWSKNGERLVSADLFGRVVVWQPDDGSGIWKPRVLVDEDSVVLSEPDASRLRDFRGFHPVVWSGDDVISAHFVRFNKGPIQYPIWKLVATRFDGSSKHSVSSDELPGLVSDICASDNGRLLAVACYSARVVRLYRKSNDGGWKNDDEIALRGRPLWVRMNAEATRLAVAMEEEIGATSAPATVSVYEIGDSGIRQLSRVELDQTASAGVFDPSNNAIILAVGSRVETFPLSAAGKIAAKPTQTLMAPTLPITRVAVSGKDGAIRIGISRSRDKSKPVTELFDLNNVKLAAIGDHGDDAFLENQRLSRKWTLRPSLDTFGVYDWYADDEKIGPLPLDPTRHGRPTEISTVRANDGTFPLLLVGTSGQNGVYVFSVPSRRADGTWEQPELKRWYRGHSGAVRSISATTDGSYLFSGGDDALVNVWNLEGAGAVSKWINRWGAELDADAVVQTIDEAGPLYFRGVRIGDRLTRFQWPNAEGEVKGATASREIRDALDTVPFDTQVVFEFERQGQPIGTFQMFPAWYPLATLMVDSQREWALWTPSGIYNASLMGNRRFGWQLNRGLNEDVDFFTADHFEKTLERPEVMRRLLTAGSLASAMRQTVGGAPAPGESAIVNQIQSRPRIKLISPSADGELHGDVLDVVAKVECPPGVPLALVRAFVDGIPGDEILGDEVGREGLRFRWRFALPRQRRLELKVVAVTEGGTSNSKSIMLSRAEDDLEKPSQTNPQMHVFGVGIGQYADANIQSLDFPAAASMTVANTFRRHASAQYDVTTQQLLDRQATRPLWRIYAEATVEDLRERVSPDDLVVMYLCGHGLRDRRTGNWYFVTANASYRDLMEDQYQDCLSMTDLSLFSSLPCRKLAILDSCHSGAVQSQIRGDDLKAALRYLQNDHVMTLTASEGNEEAAEVVESGMGRFTFRLVEGLRGAADENRDGAVTLDETVRYVTATVSADAEVDSMQQHPTASPPELIQRLELPLTSF